MALNNDERFAWRSWRSLRWPVGARVERRRRRWRSLAKAGEPRRMRQLRSARRRRLVSGFYALVACPVFFTGLYGVQEYGSTWYGVVGLVLAIALLWASSRMARWLP